MKNQSTEKYFSITDEEIIPKKSDKMNKNVKKSNIQSVVIDTSAVEISFRNRGLRTESIPSKLSIFEQLLALDLGFNKIDSFPRGLPKNLLALDLSFNLLTNCLSFKTSILLMEIHLNNNHISSMLGLGYIVTLEHINLSNNLIKAVEGLETLENLQTLILSNNFISTSLNLRSLFVNSYLKILDVTANPVSSQHGFRSVVSQFIPSLRELNGVKINVKPTKLAYTINNNQNKSFSDLSLSPIDLSSKSISDYSTRYTEIYDENRRRSSSGPTKNFKSVGNRSQSILGLTNDKNLDASLNMSMNNNSDSLLLTTTFGLPSTLPGRQSASSSPSKQYRQKSPNKLYKVRPTDDNNGSKPVKEVIHFIEPVVKPTPMAPLAGLNSLPWRRPPFPVPRPLKTKMKSPDKETAKSRDNAIIADLTSEKNTSKQNLSMTSTSLLNGDMSDLLSQSKQVNAEALSPPRSYTGKIYQPTKWISSYLTESINRMPSPLQLTSPNQFGDIPRDNIDAQSGKKPLNRIQYSNSKPAKANDIEQSRQTAELDQPNESVYSPSTRQKTPLSEIAATLSSSSGITQQEQPNVYEILRQLQEELKLYSPEVNANLLNLLTPISSRTREEIKGSGEGELKSIFERNAEEHSRQSNGETVDSELYQSTNNSSPDDNNSLDDDNYDPIGNPYSTFENKINDVSSKKPDTLNQNAEILDEEIDIEVLENELKFEFGDASDENHIVTQALLLLLARKKETLKVLQQQL